MKKKLVKKQNKSNTYVPSHSIFVRVVAGICALLLIGSLFTYLIK